MFSCQVQVEISEVGGRDNDDDNDDDDDDDDNTRHNSSDFLLDVGIILNFNISAGSRVSVLISKSEQPYMNLNNNAKS